MQLIGSKYGFTLFELMLVISIFWIFVFITSSFDLRPQTNIEKTDRMQIALSSNIRTEMQNIRIGKMPQRDGRIASSTIITIGTGGASTEYMSGVSIIDTKTFNRPFFDNDTIYEIKDVIWTGSSSFPNGMSWTGQVIIGTSGISFSGINISGSGYTLLEIQVWYNNTTRRIVLDRRTGKLSETKR